MKKILSILVILMLVSVAFAVPGNGPFAQGKERNPIDINEYKAQRNLGEAKEGYTFALNQYKEKREQYHLLINDLNNMTPAQKVQAKEQIRVKSQAVLSNQADALINKLLQLEERGVAPDNVEDLIAALEEIRLRMLAGDADKNEIVSAIKEIRDSLIPQVKEKTQLKMSNALNNKFEAIFNKAELAEQRFSTIIEKLDSNGYDTNNLREALNNYTLKIVEAEAKYVQAKEIWDSSTEDVFSARQQGFEIAKEANQLIVEGFQELRTIVQEIVAQNNGDLI